TSPVRIEVYDNGKAEMFEPRIGATLDAGVPDVKELGALVAKTAWGKRGTLGHYEKGVALFVFDGEFKEVGRLPLPATGQGTFRIDSAGAHIYFETESKEVLQWNGPLPAIK